MNSLWLFCLLGGLLAFVAGWLNWNWFFADRHARRIATALGRKSERVAFAVLGILLLGLGVYLGSANHWALTERAGCEIIVEGKFPGQNARVVASAIAVPLDIHFDRDLPGIRLVVSKSRAGGGFRDSLLFDPKMDPLQAKLDVEAALNDGYAFMPRSLKQPFTDEIVKPQARGGHVAIAIVAKTEDVDEAALQDFAHAVQKRLAEEQALADPLPLDDQLPDRDGIPKLVVRVNRNPAVRIAGSPPLGKSLSWARARCLILAELERKKRTDGQNFEVVNLGNF